MTERLVQSGFIAADQNGYGVTPSGGTWFQRLGIDVDDLSRRRRAFARPCEDWTEKREHLAGSLGAAVATRLLHRGEVRLGPQARSIIVSRVGWDWIRFELGIRCPWGTPDSYGTPQPRVGAASKDPEPSGAGSCPSNGVGIPTSNFASLEVRHRGLPFHLAEMRLPSSSAR